MTDQEKMKQSVIFWATLLSQPEQPEQEPVALIQDGVLRWHIPHEHYSRPAWTAHGTHMLYTAPPQRKPLIDEEIMDIVDAQRAKVSMDEARLGYRVARAVEQAHGIKETP